MSSNHLTSTDEPLVERIAEEILERQRAGERPTVEEYCERYPEQAEELRSFLPALIVVEGLKPNSQDVSGTFGGDIEIEGKRREFIGDYRILRELGRGGMGVVYEAEQQSLGRHVALKVLLRSVAGDVKAAKRFESEAKAAARMHHTHIVPVFDVGSDDQHLFYAMQLIQGQAIDLVIDDLKQLRNLRGSGDATNGAAKAQKKSIARSLVAGQFHQDQLLEHTQASSPADAAVELIQSDVTETLDVQSTSSQSAVLPGQRDMSSAENNRPGYFLSVAKIGHQTAEALAYAHARGIIHRDIKPSNLLLDGNGIVWITDFGLAKTGDHGMTHTGDILGTIRYMSPERFKGQCDVRADVYSLGLTLYELLTLQPAFAAADQLKLIDRIVKSEPPAPRTLDASVPRDLETIVLKCIDKDPRRRYQSADELCEDLERFVHDEPIKARRISFLERVARWSRRNKAMAASLAVAATLLLLINIAGPLITWRMARLKNEAELSEVKALQAQALASERADTLNRTLYFANMNLAGVAASSPSGIRQVMELTDEWLPQPGEPDLRGWEWYYLRSLVHQDLHTLMHDDWVNSVAWSPDGKRLATTSGKIIKIWNGETGQLLEEWSSSSEVLGISWHPSGTKLAWGSGNKTISIWDLDQQRAVLTLKGHHDKVGKVVWSPDGRKIASASAQWLNGTDTSLRIWDAVTGQQKFLIEPSYTVDHLAWSADGKQLASAGKNRVAGTQNRCGFTIWNADNGQEVGRLPLRGNAVTAMAWSPDNTRVITCNRASVSIWDPKSGKILSRLNEESSVLAVAWSPDSSHFATGLATRSINIWDADALPEWTSAESPNPERTTSKLHPSQVLQGHTYRLSSLAWSPNGKRLASGCGDQTAKIWDVEPLLPDESLDTGSRVLSFTWDSNRNPLLICSHRRDFSWEVRKAKDEEPLQSFRRFFKGVPVLSPDGRRLAAWTANGIEVWSIETGQQEHVWPLPHTGGVISWSPDSKRLASATMNDDNLIRLFNAETGEEEGTLRGHTTFVRSLAWHPNKPRLASGPMVGDSAVRIWDIDTGKCLATLTGHRGIVYAVAWSPDGKVLASGAEDFLIYLWNSETYEREKTLSGHVNFLRSLDWSPDGRRIASTSRDDKLMVWDTESGRETFSKELSFIRPEDGWVRWSPEGHRLATISEGSLVMLDASEGYTIEAERLGTGAR